MAAGQQNNPKVGFIIQARMKSTRLPGKVLLPLPLNGGKPIIQWIVDSVRRSKFTHKVILATSVDKENDPLQDYCVKNGIECFRGDEENVLSRFIEIIEKNTFDVVVRLTGDNPLVDIAILDEVIAFHLFERNDYTKTEGMPIGMNFEIVRPSALVALKSKLLSLDDKEHVTLRIRNEIEFKLGRYAVEPNLERIRLTIDYPTDFLVAATLLPLLDQSDILNSLIQVASQFNWLVEANTSNVQKKFFEKQEDELTEAVAILRNLDFKYSANILRSFKD